VRGYPGPGLSHGRSEYIDGVCCIAAPIRDRDVTVIASIGISAPAVRVPKEWGKECAEHVVAAAVQIGHTVSSLEE
jgi:IclR family acetate operon transcriptional repressor